MSPTEAGTRGADKKRMQRQERLSWSAVALLNLALAAAIAYLGWPYLLPGANESGDSHVGLAIRAMTGLLLLLDLYILLQRLQIRRARRESMQSKEIFQIISENAADMIAVVDADGKRIYNSDAYAKILGYTSEELQATSSLAQIHPDDLQKVQQAAKAAREGAAGQNIEYRMRHKDGNWRFLESTASVVRDEDGKIEKLVIVNRDVTERKLLEEKFQQAQKMEAVGRLAGGIAHDFNNLLGVMMGYAEAGQRRLEQNNPVRANFDEILATAKRAASLTQQLLAFSRQQVLNPVVLDINGIVAEVEKMLGRVIGSDIDLTIRLATGLGRVKADHSQIEQILMNLAVNARDAMPKGGKLIIQTANLTMDDTFVRQHPYPVKRGNYVCLTVSDTGVGMDSQTRAKAFQPFFTTKEKGKGTGLGLSTVYGIVKQSGGYVDIHSAVGDGTTFKIYLPRTEELLGTAGKRTSESAAVAMATETILLAEDETALRILTRDALRERGFTVLEAKDGREALEIQRAHIGVIDLLLTDIVMPEVGGHALGQEIVRERPGIRILYMSGYTDSYTNLLLGNGKSFVRKPFTNDVLMEKIREALESEVVAE